jgi:hypothetical protein
MQKIVNVLAVASSVVSLAVVGLGGYVFINKDSIIQGVTDKAMDSVLGGGFGGGAAGGALGGGALPGMSDPEPQQAPPEAPAAGFGLPQ